MKYELKTDSGKMKFWSRKPGLYVDPNTAEELKMPPPGSPWFVSITEWYNELGKLIREINKENDFKGVVVTSRSPHTILEHLLNFRPQYDFDASTNKSTYTHGELSFQESVLDDREIVEVYYDNTLSEGAMYYVTEDGTYTPIVILNMDLV